MGFTAFETPMEFHMKNVFTWGLKDTKYNKYSLGIKLGAGDHHRVVDLIKHYKTKNPLYAGETLYLKFPSISLKQREELLNIGKCYVNVDFQCTGVYKNKDQQYLSFHVLGLGLAGFIENDETAPADI